MRFAALTWLLMLLANGIYLPVVGNNYNSGTLPTVKTPTPTETPIPPTATATVMPTGTPSGQGCHPSYPTLCVPPPPDLSCDDVRVNDFPVTPPDPHGFDRDRDGIGCESSEIN